MYTGASLCFCLYFLTSILDEDVCALRKLSLSVKSGSIIIKKVFQASNNVNVDNISDTCSRSLDQIYRKRKHGIFRSVQWKKTLENVLRLPNYCFIWEIESLSLYWRCQNDTSSKIAVSAHVQCNLDKTSQNDWRYVERPQVAMHSNCRFFGLVSFYFDLFTLFID